MAVKKGIYDFDWADSFENDLLKSPSAMPLSSWLFMPAG